MASGQDLSRLALSEVHQDMHSIAKHQSTAILKQPIGQDLLKPILSLCEDALRAADNKSAQTKQFL